MTNAMAVKFVDGEPNTIEGLGIPFGGPANGKDLTGTYFTPKTDFALKWFPDNVRPLLFEHGLDGEVRLDPVGTFSVKSWDNRGGWVQAKLDEASEYAEAVKELVAKGALFFSSGSIDHLYTTDKSGAIKTWPLIEMSLTTKPANPDQPPLAVRSVDAVLAHLEVLGIAAPEAIKKQMDEVGGEKVDRDKIDDSDFAGPNRSFPITNQESVDAAAHLLGHADNPDEVKAKIIAIAKRKGLDIPDAWKDDAGKSVSLEAIKAGARNSRSDQSHLDAAHEAAHNALQHTYMAGANCDACGSTGVPDDGDGDEDSAAGKSTEIPPAPMLAVKAGDDVATLSDADLAALRESLSSLAVKTAQDILRR